MANNQRLHRNAAISRGGRGAVPVRLRIGSIQVLHSFPIRSRTEGIHPETGLVRGSDGLFYGITPKGGRGTYDDGTFYRIDAAGNYELLYDFECPDACAPNSGVIEIAPGRFVGTTRQGGVEKYATDYVIQVN